MSINNTSGSLEDIRANAELVVEGFRKSSSLLRFGFDAPSVEWVDGFIERTRVEKGATPEFVDKMVNILGSYLGECIVRTYGGRWSHAEDGWRVEFDPKNSAYPFAKVAKQFAGGKEAGDSIYSFFTAIPIVFPSLRSPS